MKKFALFAVAALATSAISFGALILDTGLASPGWQVATTGVGLGTATILTPAQSVGNPAWIAAPNSSKWITGTYLAVNPGSNAALQGTPCSAVGGNPGVNCAYGTFTANDSYNYVLQISAASLAAQSASAGGTVSVQFTGDDRATLYVGNRLGVMNAAGPGTLSAVTNITFTAADLNAGALTIYAIVNNNSANFNGGNTTGFVLTGNLTGAPEPATFGLLAVAGLAGIAARRKMVR